MLRASRRHQGSITSRWRSSTKAWRVSSSRGSSTATRAGMAWLAGVMVERLDGGAAVDVVTWAPTTPQRRRARGFDHAELLARAVGRRAGLPARGLLTRLPGPPQTGPARPPRGAGVPSPTRHVRPRRAARRRRGHHRRDPDCGRRGTSARGSGRGRRPRGGPHPVTAIGAAPARRHRIFGSSGGYGWPRRVTILLKTYTVRDEDVIMTSTPLSELDLTDSRSGRSEARLRRVRAEVRAGSYQAPAGAGRRGHPGFVAHRDPAESRRPGVGLLAASYSPRGSRSRGC